jgi:hypothetical protein
MPVVTKNYGEIALTSSYYAYTEQTGEQYTDTATTADSSTFSATFDTLGIPAGSTINSAKFTYTVVTSPLHGSNTRAVRSGSTTVISPFDSGSVVNLSSIASFYIRFISGKYNTSYPARPVAPILYNRKLNSSTWRIKDVTLTVDYTLPYSACTAPTSVSVNTNNIAPGATTKLSWSGAGAGTNNAIKEYQVHRSTSSGGSYTHIATTTSTSANVTAPTGNGDSYYYKILTVGTVSGYSSG